MSNSILTRNSFISRKQMTLGLPVNAQIRSVLEEIAQYRNLLYSRSLFQLCFDLIFIRTARTIPQRFADAMSSYGSSPRFFEREIKKIIIDSQIEGTVDLTNKELIETAEEFYSLFFRYYSKPCRAYLSSCPVVLSSTLYRDIIYFELEQ